MNLNRVSIFLVLGFLLVTGCGTEQKKPAVIIGISTDPESLNPLYSFSGYEMAITEVLYPSLVQHHWDTENGLMVSSPLLADKWEWAEDSSSLKIHLREDLLWSDGKNVTAEDIVLSFNLFSDPAVQSRLYGIFSSFLTDDELKILPESFEVENKFLFRIIFRENAIPSLIDIDVPILPAHVFGELKRDEIIFSEKDINPVTCGPYRLKSWNRNQSVVLEKNSSSFLVNETTPEEIIFKIIPEYNARVTQLVRGEIDLIDDIKIDDVKRLKGKESLTTAFVKAREYDYIGWNNIDPVKYASGSIIPNELFSSAEIRTALTMAVNRKEILNDYLLNYGELAVSPVSPIFKTAYNGNILPLDYNPAAAREILKKNNWVDRNNNGIVDKQGKEFTFTLNIPSGNPRREFAALFIRNNLKLVGIDAKIEPMEPSVFFEKLFKRELNAWIAGWSIPIPPVLKPYWYSDLNMAPFNVVSFRNEDADLLLNSLETERDSERRNLLMMEFQQLLYRENPVTFLYWIDNIVGYNKRIKKIAVTPLGAVHNMWEWETDE
jgi:peptide/nickel transport system substrate-binding protein